MNEIDEYLKSRLGKIWRLEDHEWLCARLDKMDKLVQDVAKLRSYVAKATGVLTI